jgi:DNA-binding response OmpR family regulator
VEVRLAKLGPNVLIVDDDPESRNLLSEFLAANGYSVGTVSDGAAARAELGRAEDYQVVVADLQMPNESGLDLLRKLRTQKSKCSIILMSSFISQEEKKEAQKLGVHALLEKPFRLTDLLQKVEEVAPRKPTEISPEEQAVSPAGSNTRGGEWK